MCSASIVSAPVESSSVTTTVSWRASPTWVVRVATWLDRLVTAFDAATRALRSNCVSFFLQEPSRTRSAPDFFWHSRGAAPASVEIAVVAIAHAAINGRVFLACIFIILLLGAYMEIEPDELVHSNSGSDRTSLAL